MSADELFPVEVGQALSPRLAWMKRNGIITLYHAPGHGVPPTWFAGFQSWRPEMSGIDFFFHECAEMGDSRLGEGDTEDEALAHLLNCWDARRICLRLWNEETA